VVPINVESDRKGPALRKLYFTIGEVSEQLGVPAHVLRYWESEFPQLRPKKGRAGNRLYQDRDIETITRIKTLLYDQRFTIAGAKTQLSQVHDSHANGNGLMEEVRKELHDILKIMNDSSGRGAAR
jgi:DNA-binding transcriptional MerR regulator